MKSTVFSSSIVDIFSVRVHLVNILSLSMGYEILLSIMSYALYELHLDLNLQRSGMLLLFVNSDNAYQ